MKVQIQDGEGDAQIRVATLVRYNPDDLEGECSKCHRPIFYRPEPPYLITFLCLECARTLKPDGICVSSKTVAFVRTLLKIP